MPWPFKAQSKTVEPKKDEQSIHVAEPLSAKAEEKVKTADSKVADPRKAAFFSSIVLKPWTSEKSVRLEKQNKYGFIVAAHATKNMVKDMVSGIYGVHPLKVNLIMKKMKVRGSGKFRGHRKAHKTAIVTLPESEKIEITSR